MAKLSNRKLLLIALLLSFITALLVYQYLKGVTSGPLIAESVPVVVAKVDIQPKTKITLEMVSEVKIPPEYMQPGAVTSLDKVVGIMVREPIVSGEQISERRLVRESKSVGFTGIIPRDRRAVTVAVNEVTGVAGFVKPGDYVDVVVSFDAAAVGDHASQVVMQNLLVLAANHDTEISTGDITVKESVKEVNKMGTVTMAVTPDEAAKLSLVDEKGKIRLALRPYLPINSLVLTEAVTPKDLVGIHVSPVKNEQASPAATSPATGERQNPQSVKGPKVIRGTKLES